jgi:hypothetical protein
MKGPREGAWVAVDADHLPLGSDVTRDHLRDVAVPTPEVEHAPAGLDACIGQEALHHPVTRVDDHAAVVP